MSQPQVPATGASPDNARDGAGDDMRNADAGDIRAEHLEQMAAMMATALAQLDCPDCCGPVYEFVEVGAVVYGEEMEWACLAHTVRRRRGK